MNKKGFTLIELIASVAIMVILSIIVTASISRISQKQDAKRYATFKEQIENAACVYIDLSTHRLMKEACYNNCTVNVGTLINDGLLSSELVNPETEEPVDPTTNVSVTWDNDGVKTCTYGTSGVLSASLNVVGVDYTSYYALTPNYTFDFPLTVKIREDGNNIIEGTKDRCTFMSSDTSLVTIVDNKIKTSSNTSDTPATVIFNCGGYIGQINVRVTSLIHDKNNKSYLASPKFSDYSNKQFISCSAKGSTYPTDSIISSTTLSNSQISRLNEILEAKVNAAGYGTRAGVVEAARFLAVNFPYRIPYAYGDWDYTNVSSIDNRRNKFVVYNNLLTNNTSSSPYGVPNSDQIIFGKYFKRGLNISTSSVTPTYSRNCTSGSTLYGNGCEVNITNLSSNPNTSWGCQIGKADQNNCSDNPNGSGCGYAQYMPNFNGSPLLYLNGLDCTGFIYWALMNGGVLPARGTNKEYNVNSTAFLNKNGGTYAGTSAAGEIVYISDYATSQLKDHVKVGDIAYKSANDGVGGSHMGIIIGIDDTYFYIAESTGASISSGHTDAQLNRGGLIVSRACKNPSSCPNGDDNRGFNIIMLMETIYPDNDGHLTDMWES